MDPTQNQCTISREIEAARSQAFAAPVPAAGTKLRARARGRGRGGVRRKRGHSARRRGAFERFFPRLSRVYDIVIVSTLK